MDDRAADISNDVETFYRGRVNPDWLETHKGTDDTKSASAHQFEQAHATRPRSAEELRP